jgi:molybdate/tungstate transport system substrate-binding protein
MSKRDIRALAVTVCLATSVTSVAALTSTGAADVPRNQQARAASRGTVSVLFAGSLVKYMEQSFGPSFERAAGYGFRGFGGGSTELASEIRGRVRTGDVFVSASAKADKSLEGPGNGGWVSWYSTFTASPLELAYNPSSKFGKEVRRGIPWYRLLTQSGTRVGRTDPQLDPKGVLTVEAVENASRKLHDPALVKALGSFEVFPETGLVGRMQSGQLDAGFFYAVEAKNAKLSTVALTPAYKYAAYTVTILNHVPNPSAAAALVRYLLSSTRSYSLRKNGLNPMSPKFSGSASAVPSTLRSLVGAH